RGRRGGSERCLRDSNWTRTGDKFEWTVEIPAGTTATALIPGPDSSRETKTLAPGKHRFVTEL
uniref:alpha-L-rhamnosidase C-terminal domain-containing protein n=1 Tax=Candidatus Cryptobacteroides bacterium TaxID=3085639 RepID=UPI004029CEDE